MSNFPAKPVNARFWSSGTVLLFVLMLIGGAFALARFIWGIEHISNLSNSRPWGLWVAVDVATGVALAAGGFTTAALAFILGRKYYEAVTKPALLTAALGYTFVVIGLNIDVGRPWAMYNPILHPQFNSVLCEVAICVMCYLTVLYLEFAPMVIERFADKFPVLKSVDWLLDRFMWLFIILGVVLSCMHQSSLGSLMLIAPTKVHPLWYTPILPLLFLSSAIAVGFPMVIFETISTAKSLDLDPELPLLSRLSRYSILLIGIYMLLKVGDIVYRGAYVHLLENTVETTSFLVEMIMGVFVPFIMLLFPKVRHSRRGLFIAAALFVLGVVLNRINVFIVSFSPPYGGGRYFPSIGEIAVTVGLISTLMFIFRIAILNLPIVSAHAQEKKT